MRAYALRMTGDGHAAQYLSGTRWTTSLKDAYHLPRGQATLYQIKYTLLVERWAQRPDAGNSANLVFDLVEVTP